MIWLLAMAEVDRGLDECEGVVIHLMPVDQLTRVVQSEAQLDLQRAEMGGQVARDYADDDGGFGTAVKEEDKLPRVDHHDENVSYSS